jgi:hypothetical protein
MKMLKVGNDVDTVGWTPFQAPADGTEEKVGGKFVFVEGTW